MRRINEKMIETFVKDLKKGILQPLLEKTIKDDTIQLEFRDKYLSIYYRGGCVSKLEWKSNDFYEDYFNNNYKNINAIMEEEEEENDLQLQMQIKSYEDCLKLVEKIIERKEYMNHFFANRPKREREYQQVVERENNDREDSNYYIVDIEYANNSSRFDMIAVQRKDYDDYQKLKPAIIEMKYGSKAIGNKCGIYEHYKDVKKLSLEECKDIIEDTEIIMKYKYELGIIKTTRYVDRGIKINNLDKIDLIFFISGITLKHNKMLLEEIEKIKYDEINDNLDNRNIKLNVKVFCTYMAGNIIFDKDIISIDEFLKLSEYRKNMI